MPNSEFLTVTPARLPVIFCLTFILSIGTFAQASEADELRVPDVPCSQIRVPEGNRLLSRTYAIGVQIYRWNGAAWDFVAPEASLFADPGFRGKIGTHYGGPTWESSSGSSVVGTRVAGCDPDPTAVSWLLLRAASSDGPGIFRNVTYIQRVNTAGGLRPSLPGSYVGEEKRVPYTTEYYFYRDGN